jgi:Zn-dependent protease
MFRSLHLGRFVGIDVFLHPTFLLLLAYVLLFAGGLDSALFLSAVFGCVLLHEFGHALAARLYRIRTRHITLYPIGGVAQLERMPRSAGPELVVTAAGPAVNLALAAVFFGVVALGNLLDPGAARSTPGQILSLLASVNLGLFLFNLLPAFPMDGGRILRAALSGWLGRLRATEIATGIGQAIALLFPVVTLRLGIFSPLHLLLAAFVFLAARNELRAAREETQPPDDQDGGGSGIWMAPPGHHWIRRGNGLWQLVPIPASDPHRFRGR